MGRPSTRALGRRPLTRRWTGGHVAAGLTGALGAPAILASTVLGDATGVGLAALTTAVAAAFQLAVPPISRAMSRRIRRRDVRLTHLAISLVQTAILIEVVIPASFALYIPVVGLAAAFGKREGILIGATAIALYLLPVVVRASAQDPELLARGVAGAAVCALVAGGARFFVGNLESTTRDLRRANARERRRIRQIAGIEEVGRLLVTGPTPDALSRVMDVLVERFDYQYVSIYLARDDKMLELGAQRGYSTPIHVFDGSYGVVGRVMRERAAELVPDVMVDPDYQSANPDVISEISAPLILGDDFLGIINVESASRTLDQTDFRLVVAVADQLAAYLALGRERERLAELAVRDPLTGLHNRRFLDESLLRLFAARARLVPERREPVTAILFDLDHFGDINKRHGLAVGDAVLRRAGRILADSFRQADLVARYGGEEFLVVLIGSPLADSERRANDVRLAIATEDANADPAGSVTISAGCATLEPTDERGADALLQGADVALNMAKRGGRDQVVTAVMS